MLEVIGERVNTSRKLLYVSVAERNADYSLTMSKKQQEVGPFLST